MGAWGTAIFSDDLACDIREDWRDYIGDGLTPQAATQRILAEYAVAAADQDQAGVVWLALAVSQWRTGRTVSEVLERAIEVIDNGSDLRRWDRENPRQRPARARVLAKTREQLLSPPPRPRPIPRPQRSATPYRPGDLLGYRHGSGREFVFWVSRNWSDKGGEYNAVEVLDVAGSAVPSLPDPRALPALRSGAALRRAADPLLAGRAGLTLISASRIPADRIRHLGHVPYPAGRPRTDSWGASPRDLDQVLDQLAPDGNQAPDQ